MKLSGDGASVYCGRIDDKLKYSAWTVEIQAAGDQLIYFVRVVGTIRPNDHRTVIIFGSVFEQKMNHGVANESRNPLMVSTRHNGLKNSLRHKSIYIRPINK